MPRSARKYDRRVDFYTTTESDNGFGGVDVTPVFEKKLWAQIESIPSDDFRNLGLEVGRETFTARCRRDPDVSWDDVTLYVQYDGNDYTITQIFDVDNKGIEVEMIISK